MHEHATIPLVEEPNDEVHVREVVHHEVASNHHTAITSSVVVTRTQTTVMEELDEHNHVVKRVVEEVTETERDANDAAVDVGATNGHLPVSAGDGDGDDAADGSDDLLPMLAHATGGHTLEWLDAALTASDADGVAGVVVTKTETTEVFSAAQSTVQATSMSSSSHGPARSVVGTGNSGRGDTIRHTTAYDVVHALEDHAGDMHRHTLGGSGGSKTHIGNGVVHDGQAAVNSANGHVLGAVRDDDGDDDDDNDDSGDMDMAAAVNEASRPVTAASSKRRVGVTRMDSSETGRDLVDALADAVLQRSQSPRRKSLGAGGSVSGFSESGLRSGVELPSGSSSKRPSDAASSLPDGVSAVLSAMDSAGQGSERVQSRSGYSSTGYHAGIDGGDDDDGDDSGDMDMAAAVNEASRPVTAASSKRRVGVTRMDSSETGRDLVDALADAVLHHSVTLHGGGGGNDSHSTLADRLSDGHAHDSDHDRSYYSGSVVSHAGASSKRHSGVSGVSERGYLDTGAASTLPSSLASGITSMHTSPTWSLHRHSGVDSDAMLVAAVNDARALHAQLVSPAVGRAPSNQQRDSASEAGSVAHGDGGGRGDHARVPPGQRLGSIATASLSAGGSGAGLSDDHGLGVGSGDEEYPNSLELHEDDVDYGTAFDPDDRF